MRIRLGWSVSLLIGLSCASAAGCGASPTEPAAPVALEIQVAPDLMLVSLVAATAETDTYRIDATARFAQTGGTPGRIARITTTIALDDGGTYTRTHDASVDVPGYGSVAVALSHEFSLSAPAGVTWRIFAAGTDSMGRAFQTDTRALTVVPPDEPIPAFIVSGQPIELWDTTEFLGCYSCGRREPEAIANRFGRFGSRFSATSIWNRASMFGSRTSARSVCNESASDPPWLVTMSGESLGALTLNGSHPGAIPHPAVVDWLRTRVCAE